MGTPFGDPFGTEALRTAVLDAWRGSRTRFREDANAEEDLRYGAYRDRLLVELAQNAADAAMQAGTAGVLRLSVVGGELRVANTGAPLDAEGVAALASLRASAKRDGSSVGRFGIGFAAVLAVTDAPRVMSTSGGVSFSAERTSSTIAAHPELAEMAAAREGAVPVLRLPWPVEEGEPPPPEGFTTEVRLPLRPGVDADALLASAEQDAPDLLLALPGLARIEMGDRAWWREDTGQGVVVLHGGGRAVRWLVRRTSGELSEEQLAGLGVEARERPQWTVCWAVPLTENGAAAPLREDVLHVPTPTDERTSVPARLLATVPVEPSRRRLLPGRAADAVLTEAVRAYPTLVTALPPEQRTALVPLPGFPLSEVDGKLRELVLAELRTSAWLPLAAGGEVAPRDAKVLDLPSAELAGLLGGVLTGLLPAEFAESRHARALAALDVPRLRVADVVAAVTGVDRPPAWWHRLYAALDPLAEQDVTAREELGGLPVPLIDGRTVLGPRGVLLPEADSPTPTMLSSLDVAGLRVVHPEATHPLLARLGARRADADQLLDAPALQAAVESSVADAVSGTDPQPLADVVLRLVGQAGAERGSRPWLAALALPDADGEPRRADELVLPDAPLREILDPAALGAGGPLGVLDGTVAERWPRDVLTGIGVLDSFTLLTDDAPSGPDHGLPDEESWWATVADDVVTELVAVPHLDLVAEGRWPEALRLLTADPDTRRVLYQRTGYTPWWLARNAVLAGRPPRDWRLPSARSLAGLYDPLPDIGLDESLLTAVGVRADLAVSDVDDAVDLVRRLGEKSRPVPAGAAIWAHAALAEAVRAGRVDVSDLDPPERVRVLSGDAVAADDAVVLDRPWSLGVLPAERVVSAGPEPFGTEPAGEGEPSAARSLADLFDLPLASDEVVAEVISEGEPVGWAELGAVVVACDLLGCPVPAGDVVVHDELLVRVETADRAVPWWVTEDGRVHAEDTPEGLARALAWVLARWPDRHLLAALITDPVNYLA
ncbi:sacsin N-terminal ATP-binding-like domain-containing protein [Gandjariella thermophila]|uniref:Molecular chaperone Hsp90 n=1 Tax=Gandjariella thermophila TaxID=1931992 RepID=A0A4D4J0M9_9PSEU|nr:hypothetical protein [Gandjariella thermophila]GDY30175.1 molecular chaperone Hsp90 [Gandjariella thermophila]